MLLFIFFAVSFIHAQAPDWLWANKAGGTGTDWGQSIATDSNGNCYITGLFTGTVQFGSIPLTGDVYIAKLDPDGNWLWAVSAVSNSANGYSISTDINGNSYVTGYFCFNAQFGSIQLTGSGSYDVFIAKLDPDGNWLWAVKAGGTGDDKCYSISTDINGNSYVTGHFWGNAQFGSIPLTASGSYDVFIAKLDPDGNWLWAVKAGGDSYEMSLGISTDINGNSYVTGFFYGNVQIGSITLTSNGIGDVFIVKLDTNGDWQWAVSAGGTDRAWGRSISTDNNGNSFVTGDFYGNANFGSITLTSTGTNDIFIAKLDPDGNWLWAVSGGDVDYDYGNGISTNGNGSCYVTGHFLGNAQFGSTLITSSGYYDIFVAKCGAGDTPTRVTASSFTDKTCKLGIPILLEAKLQWEGLLSTWWDLNDESLVFQIMIDGIWNTINADIMSTTSFTTGEGDNPSGTARIYYTAPSDLPPGDYPIRVCYNGSATYAMCSSEKTLTVVKPQWLTMVYMCADDSTDVSGNLEDNALEDYFVEMWQARDNINVSVVVLIDRVAGFVGDSYGWNDALTRKYYLSADDNQGYYVPMGEQNMGDPATLTNFIESTLNECPANNVALILWNHGSGIRGDRNSQGERDICFDDTNGDQLSIYEIKGVLTNFPDEIGVIGFDACLMSMVEIAYEMKGFCSNIVASEDNENQDGWEYHNFLTWQYLTSGTTPVQYCSAIVNGSNQNTLGAWNLTDNPVPYIDLLNTALSNLSDALMISMQNDRSSTINLINNAKSNSYIFHDSQYVDLYGFCDYLNSNATDISVINYSNQINLFLSSSSFRTSWSNNYNDEVGGLSIYLPASLTSLDLALYMTNCQEFIQYNAWVTMLMYYFDNDPPSVASVSPYSFGWYNSAMNIITDSDDAGNFISGMLNVEFQYSLNNSNWYTLPGDDGDGIDDDFDNGWSLSFNTINTPVHGTINASSVWVRARARDKAGNTGNWTISSSFGVDNTDPSMSSPSITPAPIEGGISNISLTSSDVLSGIATGSPRFYYNYGNSNVDFSCDAIILLPSREILKTNRTDLKTIQTNTESRAIYTNDILIPAGTEGTTLYWKYYTKDVAGNYLWSNLYSSVIADNDTQGPVISDLYGPYSVYPGSYNFSAVFSDVSGINWSNTRLYYRYNNSTIDQSNNDGYVNFTSQQEASLNITGSHLGDHLYWRVYATDADYSPASSWSSVQDAGIIQNDIPDVDIVTPDNQTVYSPSFMVEGTADDNWNGIVLVQLKLNTGSWDTVWSGSNTDLYWDTTVTLIQGYNTIQVRAQDSEGLYSDIETIDVNYFLSLSAPTGVVISHEPTGVRIQWNPVANAGYYKIYSSEFAGAIPQDWILEQTDITQTSWIDVNPSAASKFYYVTACSE